VCAEELRGFSGVDVKQQHSDHSINLNKALNHSFSCRISKMSDVNELPDYDYDEDNREEAKNGAQDADGKKYVKLPFPSYINLSFF
jgi:hypothetical protein